MKFERRTTKRLAIQEIAIYDTKVQSVQPIQSPCLIENRSELQMPLEPV